MNSSEIVPYIGCESGFLGHLGRDCGLRIGHGGHLVKYTLALGHCKWSSW
jgi:hypothetical protein